MYIGLPKTLQDKFKIKPAEKPNEIDSFNCWHTKKFVFKRKTGLIIMNDEVRFSVVLFNIRKKEMENLLPLFKKQLKVNLSLLEISEDKIINYLSNIGDISFIKNTNRSIIGQLNDSAFALEAYLEEIDEIGTETLNILNDNLNHIPMIPLQKKGYNPFPNKAILEVINKKVLNPNYIMVGEIMKKIKVTDLRKYLKGLSNKEMENEFVNLVKNYPSVNEYFAVKVDTGNLQILTEEFKKKIEHEFFPERGFGNFDFKVIRKVISDMKKITNNNKAVIDLYLHAVLMGVLFTDEYGDINAKFYNNTLNLFYDALEIIRKKNLELEYLEKCKTIYHECPDIGWGFSDGIEELYYNYLGDFFLDDEE